MMIASLAKQEALKIQKINNLNDEEIKLEDPDLYRDFISKLRLQLLDSDRNDQSNDQEDDQYQNEEKVEEIVKQLESFECPSYISDDELRELGLSKFIYETIVDSESSVKLNLHWSSWYQLVELIDFGVKYDLVRLQSFR